MLTIRRLHPDEVESYRQVRLEALRESPDAFATTYEAALSRDARSWIDQADAASRGPDRAIFLVWDGEIPVGLAALYRDPDIPAEGELLQMWIAPAFRGHATASDLLKTLFDWASRHGYTSIRAEVTPGNRRALRFYEKSEFHRLASGHETTVLRIVLPLPA